MSKSIYVHCKVSRGLFEDEFMVTIRGSSAYVDRVNIEFNQPPTNGDEVEGRVVAYVIEEKNDQALIELPGEPVVGGPRTWVPKGELPGRFLPTMPDFDAPKLGRTSPA